MTRKPIVFGMAALLATASAPGHAALLDPGFETQGTFVSSFCYFGSCPAGAWSGSGAGLQDEGNTPWPGIPTPDGAKYGFIQSTGTFSQVFTADQTGSFSLSFLDAGRPAAGNWGGDATYQVLLDAVSLGIFSTTSAQAFTLRNTTAFNLIAGQSYTMTFAGQPSPGDNTAYIDALSLVPLAGSPGVPEPAAWALIIVGFGLAGAVARRRSARPVGEVAC